MKINWDRVPDTDEARMVADYLTSVSPLLDEMLAVRDRHDLLTMSFTPKPLGRGFYTIELRHDHLSSTHQVVVWRGLRTGDAVPLLYGIVENPDHP